MNRTPTYSLSDYLTANPDAVAAIRNKLEAATDAQVLDAFFDWRGTWARAKQLPPEGDWTTWVVRAGRAWGKTVAGACWVHERAMEHPGRWIALVARTPADARDYMIEGPGGILKNTHPRERPLYEVSKRRITWPNRSWATIFSDEEPDQLRGYSGDTAWLDEFCKFQNVADTWNNLQFGMREKSNDRPRVLVTTTPRPTPILIQIERLPSTVVITGSSYENRKNLDPRWFEDVLQRYDGTRLGRQEINAEILEDVQGALWTRELLDRCRFHCDMPNEIARARHVVIEQDNVPSVVGIS
jgi:phage terminase large subunit-like protein